MPLRDQFRAHSGFTTHTLDITLRVSALILLLGNWSFQVSNNLTLACCVPFLLFADVTFAFFLFFLLACAYFQHFGSAVPAAIGIALLCLPLSWKGRLVPRQGYLADFTSRHRRGTHLVLSLFLLIPLFLLAYRNVTWWLLLVWLPALLLLRHAYPVAYQIRAAQWAANLVLVLISSALAIAFMEVAARYTLPVQTKAEVNIWQAHPEADFTLRPGVSSSHAHTVNKDGQQEYIPTDISSQGLRDREYPPRAKDEFRAFVLGDSFTMGWGLDAEHGFVKVLERRLQKAGLPARISVINGGCASYGPWQERIFLRERGFPLEPCLVLHQLFPGNDIENTLLRIDKFPRAYNVAAAAECLRWRYQGAWPVVAEDWFKDNSALYRAILGATRKPNLVSALIWPTRFAPSQFLPVDLPKSETRAFNLETCLKDWYPELTLGWTMFEEDILAVKHDCEARGVDYAAFAIPDMCNVAEAQWHRGTEDLGPEAYERYKDIRLVEEYFQREQIPYVSLRPALQNAANKSKLYLPFDGHFTAAGAEIAAAELERFLRDRYFPSNQKPACVSQPAAQ